MGKRRYNWKARQVVDAVVENNRNSKVEVEVSSEHKQHYDDSNLLVLPSKKRKTHIKKGNGHMPTKILSKSQRKKLEKIVERKEKKKNRSNILKALAEVQASDELLHKLTSVSRAQTDGLKRKLPNSIKGAYKKKVKLTENEEQEETPAPPQDPNVVGFYSVSDYSDSSDEEQENNKDSSDEEQKNNKDSSDEEQKNNKNSSDEEQKNNKDSSDEEQKNNKDSSDEEQKNNKNSHDEEQENNDDSCNKISKVSKSGTWIVEESSKCNTNQALKYKNTVYPTEQQNIGKTPLGIEHKNTILEDSKVVKSVENGTKGSESTSDDCPVVQEVKKVPAVFIPVYRKDKIQEARLKLPILGEEQVVMETIRENPIVLIAGETGSGKTTQVPQFLYEAGYASEGKIIGITEPRRVAATSMARRVGQEMNLPESRVSYLIRFEGNATPDTQIKFMTDGVLLKELQTDFLLTKYSVIILDEAHERSMHTDILIGFLSRIVPLRYKKGNPLKLIIMSATLRLSDFTENRILFKIPPPVIKIESRQFPVTIHFNTATPEDYVKEAYRKACKIHTKLPEGGILIFVTGQEEINRLVRKLKKAFPWSSKNDIVTKDEDKSDEDLSEALKIVKANKKKRKTPTLPNIDLDSYKLAPEDDTQGDDDNLESGEEWEENEEEGAYTTATPMWVLPLYSLLPSREQSKVFQPPPKGCRLCVVSTNIAETSLTIPNIKYVVDSGKVKTRYYDKHTGVSTFNVTWTSKASANQRAGRAGRTSAGHCYRLYSSAVFNNHFEEWLVPEMLRRPIDELLLQMKAVGIDKVANFPFPSPPDKEQLEAAERRLVLLGALIPPKSGENRSSKVSPMGKSMAKFPVAPRFAKMLCLSDQCGVLEYTIAIVAALSVRELQLNDKKWQNKRRQWAGTGNSLLLGDIMVLLIAVGSAEKANTTGQLERFCNNYGLRHSALVEIRKLRRLLTSTVSTLLGVDLDVNPSMPPPTDTQANHLRQILLTGMVDQVAHKVTDQEKARASIVGSKPVYRTPDMQDMVIMNQSSALYQAAPEWIVYQEIFQVDGKMFLRGVTAIEPEWLPRYAPMLCHLSNPLSEPPPRYDPDVGTIFCHFSGTFGRSGWTLPVTELEFPEGLDRYKWFAVFFLNGSVCPGLKKFTNMMLSTPQTMVKSWAALQPRTEELLKTLVSRQVDSKAALMKQWEADRTYLLDAYQKWLPASVHNEIAMLWPPM